MRVVFSVLGLLLAVAVIGLLVKKQIAPMAAPPQGKASAQQVQQQVKQAVDTALQQSRAMPDEKP